MICLTINKVVFNVTLHCRSSNRFVRPIKHSNLDLVRSQSLSRWWTFTWSFLFSYSNKKALAL